MRTRHSPAVNFASHLSIGSSYNKNITKMSGVKRKPGLGSFFSIKLQKSVSFSTSRTHALLFVFSASRWDLGCGRYRQDGFRNPKVLSFEHIGTQRSGFSCHCPGRFSLKPHGGTKTRKCRVLQDFRARDSFGVSPVLLSLWPRFEPFGVAMGVKRGRQENPRACRECRESAEPEGHPRAIES